VALALALKMLASDPSLKLRACIQWTAVGRSGRSGAILVQCVAVVFRPGIVPALIQRRNMAAPTAPDRPRKQRTAIYRRVRVIIIGL